MKSLSIFGISARTTCVALLCSIAHGAVRGETDVELFQRAIQENDPCLAGRISDATLKWVALRDLPIAQDDLTLLSHLSTSTVRDTGFYRIALHREDPNLAAFIENEAKRRA